MFSDSFHELKGDSGGLVLILINDEYAYMNTYFILEPPVFFGSALRKPGFSGFLESKHVLVFEESFMIGGL